MNVLLGVLWKDWCWNWNSSTLATSCEKLTHWKRLRCWEGLGAGGEGDDRGWMASPTWWTWVWVNSGRWWWTGRPGVLQFMGSQRVGHNWATELNWIDLWNLLLETVPFPLFHHQKQHFSTFWASHVAQMVKNPPANEGDTGDPGLILGSGRSPGGGNGNPPQYWCLENPTDRVAWWATVHRVAKSWTWLSSEHFHTFNFSVYYFGIYL